MKIGVWKMLGAALAFAGAATMASAQGGPPDGMPAAGPLEVGVIDMQMQEIPRIVTTPGRAVAFQDVEVRPRVGGVVKEILYTP